MRLDPECQLRQLDGEWVLVDAVEAVPGDDPPAERLGLTLGETRLLALRRAARQVPHQLLVGIWQRRQPLAIPGGLCQGRLPFARRSRRLGPALSRERALVAETAGLVEGAAQEAAGFSQGVCAAPIP